MSGILINEVKTSKKAIAITFDDGPNPVYTPQVLEIFSEHGSKATFFMIGEQINAHPDMARRAAEQGHEIGNHTYSHAKLSELNRQDCVKEIARNEVITEKITGQKPVVFRPPYLDYSEETESVIQEKGYPMIGALNLGARDWEQPGADFIFNETVKWAGNGSILIFHDGYGDRSQTIEAVRKLVPELKAQNYELVTVSELLRLSGC
ncbi:polysaccharide deacetylase family protein [Domibacillus indicus]|uniref:polysaccharide deacetylase family protein n=1 Tax=Domibacillus indicus TaxID=1437523 RepID=UPI0006182A96|nr:polysaccharide deacetylase family protein [Domibacillus indicus]